MSTRRKEQKNDQVEPREAKNNQKVKGKLLSEWSNNCAVLSQVNVGARHLSIVQVTSLSSLLRT